MKEIESDHRFPPEAKEKMRKAFELGRLFSEKDPKEFIESLKSRQEEKSE